MHRPLLSALLACLVAAAATAPAQAASRLVVRGAGFGHGVGMSQYGALGQARAGRDHAAILGHYYSGTQLGRLAGPSDVRVLLKSAERIVVGRAARVAGVRDLDPSRRYVATRGLGGDVVLRGASGRLIGTYASPLAITAAAGGLIVAGRSQNGVVDGRYRGALEIRASALGGVSAINRVALEEYLLGVVAGEVPAAWPDAALRAQAVAARTYAMTTSKDGDGFDQYADTRSQVYRGVAGEHPRTVAAVAATRGEVVVYDGRPIVTYYFSTSGGRTENVENSFIGAQPSPWLRSVADPFDSVSPRHRWLQRLTLASAQRRLGGLVKGRLLRIRVLRRGASPRVVRAEVVGSGGRTRVSGPTLRARLGLYDTWARFTVITAAATRGDGNVPRSEPAGGTPATGGVQPRAARVRGPLAAGAIGGRVAPAAAGARVTVERLVGRRWVAQFDVRTAAGGRYRAGVGSPGRYRIRYAGELGPPVRVR